MTDPRLTPAETAALDTKARRWTRAASGAALAALALCAVAIWAGDSRYAATGGLVLVVALVCGVLAASANSPDTRRRLATKLRDQEADRG